MNTNTTAAAPNADPLPLGIEVFLNSDPMVVRVGELTQDLADGTHKWTIAAVEEHEGVLCYRLTCKRLASWVSYNTVMNGCPSEHDYITHEHWTPVAVADDEEN
jgi:hypothetical protein